MLGMDFWGGLAFTCLPLKRFYKYILKRLIGGFLRDDFDLEQLEVQLYHGIVQLNSLEIDVAQFNPALRSLGLCLQFVSGFVGCIKMDVPWRHLLRDHCKIYVSDLSLLLAKDSVEDGPIDGSVSGDRTYGKAGTAMGDGTNTTSTHSAHLADSQDHAGGRAGYSEDGIETLTRLVKHVLARVELCLHETQVSVQAPEPSTVLRARASSIVCFSEQHVGDYEERSFRLAGLSLSLVSLSATQTRESIEVFIISTSAPGNAVSSEPPGVLSVRRELPPDNMEPSAVLAQTGEDRVDCSGVHLDVELTIHCLRIALTPSSWLSLMECLQALQSTPPVSTTGAVGQVQAVAESSASGAHGMDPSMVRSLVESTLAGNSSQGGFWHDMYNLFEADSQLEDAAGRAESERESAQSWGGPDLDSAGDEEEARETSAPPAPGHEGPIVGYTIRIRVMHVGAVLALREDSRHTQLRPADVRLAPGPSLGIHSDQLQVCVTNLDTVLIAQSTGREAGEALAPTLTTSTDTVMMYIHRHISKDTPCNESISKDTLGASSRQGAGNVPGGLDKDSLSYRNEKVKLESLRNAQPAPASSSGGGIEAINGMVGSSAKHPAQTVTMSQSFADTSLFHSAMETVGSSGRPLAIDSLLDPALFGSATSVDAETVQVEGHFSHMRRGVSGESCITTESVGGVPSEEEESFLHSAASSLRSFDASSNPDSSRGAMAPFASSYSDAMTCRDRKSQLVPETKQETPSDDEAESDHTAVAQFVLAEPDLESIFFDRSVPIRVKLLGGTRAGPSVMDESVFIGAEIVPDVAGWCQFVPQFDSKHILCALSVREGGIQEPPLQLPQPEHPLWKDMHSAKEPSQLRATWITSASSSTSFKIESQPFTLRLCASSLDLLTVGVAILSSAPSISASSSPPSISSMPLFVPEISDPQAPNVSDKVFELAGVAPVFRVELILQATQHSYCCVVADFVAPCVFACPQCVPVGDDETQLGAGSAYGYEESVRVEFGDAIVHLVHDIKEKSERRQPCERSKAPRCLRILAIGDGEDIGTCATADGRAKGTLSAFNRIDTVPGLPPQIDPSSDTRKIDSIGSDFAAGATAEAATDTSELADRSSAAGLADWTKISVPQPVVDGRSASRSSKLLQDLRQVLQGQSQGRQSGASKASATTSHVAYAGCTSTGYIVSDEGPEDEEDDGHCDYEVTLQGQVEVEFRIRQTVHLRIDASAFSSLQESLVEFTSRIAELAAVRLQPPQIHSKQVLLPTLPIALSPSGGSEVLALCAFSLSLDALRFEMLDEDVCDFTQTGSREALFFQIAPLRCRSVQLSPTSSKVCCLGQDLRLWGLKKSEGKMEQFVRPWFQPLLNLQRPVGVGEHLSIVTPWEKRRSQHRFSVINKAFNIVESGYWCDTHSVLLQADQQRPGAIEQTNISVKVGRLLCNAHPHMQHVITKFNRFFCTLGTLDCQPVQVSAPCAVTYEVSIVDCLADVPSEAYEREWPTTHPNGLDVPTAKPSARGLDGDKWRAVMHIGGFDLSCGPVQGSTSQVMKITCSQLNCFLVDHPSHLLHLDIISASNSPVALLSGMGFARIFVASRSSAVWSSYCHSGVSGDCAAFGKAERTLEVVLGSIEVNLCADSIKCLLSVSMELIDMLPQQAGATPPSGVKTEQNATADSSVAAALTKPMTVAQEEEADTRRRIASTAGLNILENIDVTAFEETPPKVTSMSRGDTEQSSLTSCFIEDYIRDAEKMQRLRSPVQATATPLTIDAAAMPEMVLPAGALEWETESQTAATASAASPDVEASVAVCLLDPDAYSEERLRELCLEDHAARREIDEMFNLPGSRAASASQKEKRTDSDVGGREFAAKRHVIHQDGSATVWLVDPGEFQVVQDHFARWVEPGDDHKLLPPPHAPPVEFAVKFRCSSATLTLYSGTDFADEPDAQRAAQRIESGLGRRRHAPYLALELVESVVTLMDFDVGMAVQGGGSLSSSAPAQAAAAAAAAAPSGGILKRRLTVCTKDFGIVDGVPGSVFSHLLSYFEDERRRPRPSRADMLYLSFDKVVPLPFCVGVNLARQGGVGGATRRETWTTSGNTMPVVMAETGEPEYRAELRLLPLRLTIDQDVVDFLIDFVQLCALPTYVEEEHDTAETTALDEARAPDLPTAGTSATVGALAAAPQSRAAVFQHVSVGALLLSVDYRAKRLDVGALRRGELWELVNVLPLLEGLEVAFRRVSLSGVSGLSQVANQIVSAWSADLNRTQILRSFTGVTPIRSFANIGGGFAEMVLEPLKQYRAGGSTQRVSRAILRGLMSFMRHVTVESIDLTERIFVGTQSALEYASTCFSEPQAASTLPPTILAGSAFSSVAAERLSADTVVGVDSPMAWTAVQRGAADFLQPDCAAEGLQQASTSLMRGVKRAGEAVIIRPLLEFQRGAPKEKVLRSVATGIPMCVLRPAIGATAAATTALRGVRNQVDPHHREIVKKYKGPQ